MPDRSKLQTATGLNEGFPVLGVPFVSSGSYDVPMGWLDRWASKYLHGGLADLYDDFIVPIEVWWDNTWGDDTLMRNAPPDSISYPYNPKPSDPEWYWHLMWDLPWWS